ncbi:hypothetical protein DdX_15922 [Ditylenchus destructor]|uniref:Uncharacterized protein n=1 Tax=Ditylenchus destructor TaxID=166010 RepID=A0AAD4MU25_9BILA|nr:hypothetical protein DdX_15922 [Ditylenchus destructor]
MMSSLGPYTRKLIIFGALYIDAAMISGYGITYYIARNDVEFRETLARKVPRIFDYLNRTEKYFYGTEFSDYEKIKEKALIPEEAQKCSGDELYNFSRIKRRISSRLASEGKEDEW